MNRPSSNGAPGAAAAGFSLVEVLIANCVLAISILVYVQCIGTETKLNRATQEQTLAVVTLGRFVERLRADSSWPTLYARLVARSSESADDAGRTHLDMDPKLPTWPVTTYFTDLGVPATLGTVSFLVQVPAVVQAGVSVLCETEVAPRYGLPHDLNGDGAIDGNSRNNDYTALPLVVRLRWQHPGEQAREVLLATWLRGER